MNKCKSNLTFELSLIWANYIFIYSQKGFVCDEIYAIMQGLSHRQNVPIHSLIYHHYYVEMFRRLIFTSSTFTVKTQQFMFTESNHPHILCVPVPPRQASSPEMLLSGMNSRADASLTPKILLSSIQSSNNIDPTRPYNVNLIPSYASLTTISLRDPLVLATLRPYIGRINTERKI